MGTFPEEIRGKSKRGNKKSVKICGFSQLFHNLIKNVMKNAETEAKK